MIYLFFFFFHLRSLSLLDLFYEELYPATTNVAPIPLPRVRRLLTKREVNCAIVFQRKAQYYAEIPSLSAPESFMNSHCR